MQLLFLSVDLLFQVLGNLFINGLHLKRMRRILDVAFVISACIDLKFLENLPLQPFVNHVRRIH